MIIKKKLKLRRTINISFVLMVIIPLLIISIVALIISRKYIMDLSKDGSDQLMHQLQLNLQDYFEAPKNELSAIRNIMIIAGEDKEHDVLSAYFEKQVEFHHFLIIDEQGLVEYAYPNEDAIIGFDYSRESAFVQIAKGKTEAFSLTYVDKSEDKVSINYAIPFGEKTFLGVMHLDTMQEILERTVNDNSLIVGVTDDFGVYLVHTNYNYVEQRIYDSYVQEDYQYKKVKMEGNDYYLSSKKVENMGWHIFVYEPVENLNHKLQTTFLYLGLIITITVIITGVIGLKLNSFVFNSFDILLKKTKEVRNGSYNVAIEPSGFEEINELSENFMNMIDEVKSREDHIMDQNYQIESMNKALEQRVIDRTNELFSANQELEVALENLKVTQDQLVESEKLASLGNLVSGLAHEINTPLGVILTVTTYLQESTAQVMKAYETGLLKKSDFDKYLNTRDESEGLIFENVTKAIELISSFKMISAEQRNAEKRVVEVKEFIESIIKSLDPQMRKNNIALELHMKEQVQMETVPIALYQILVNLIMNVKAHAYDEDGGKVDVFVKRLTNMLEITVQDYGNGIEADSIKHIFEPFYTTKRGKGGTGLGLSIVYNTVKQNLKGEILCYSEREVGTQFIVKLPYEL